MESITPHYTSLGPLKLPDIVKLNTCMLFMTFSTMKCFLIRSVALVSELQYPQCIIQPSRNTLISTQSSETLPQHYWKFLLE